jgi:hypothetical protein
MCYILKTARTALRATNDAARQLFHLYCENHGAVNIAARPLRSHNTGVVISLETQFRIVFRTMRDAKRSAVSL